MPEQGQIKMMYLLGAGRSGTTLMAAALNNAHERILSLGELHQFKEHLIGAKQCSCGKDLEGCAFWGQIIRRLPKEIGPQLQQCEQKEKHRNIPKLLFSSKSDLIYLKVQEDILEQIKANEPTKLFLDSSKYIARYLLLSRSQKISIKGIYVVRDIRGVINSFSKQVQTPKKPLATIIYYMLVNFFAQLVCWSDKRVIKVKYEDFVEHPNEQIQRIQRHVFGEDNKGLTLSKELKMPHIIGGNRMKHSERIVISPDYKWKKTISKNKQAIYYLAALPFMIINRYKI